MRLPRFEYLSPKSKEEALSFFNIYQEEVKVLAGGTDLLPNLKHKLYIPKYIMDLKKISGLSYIAKKNGKIKIGTLTTLDELATSNLLKEKVPALAEASNLVATNQIRNMGTIGGNICLNTRCWFYNQSHWWRKSREICLKRGGEVCHVVKKSDRCYACFQSDTAPVLIALGAEVRIVNPKEERVTTLESIYTGEGKKTTNLAVDDLIEEIWVPEPRDHTGCAYTKLRIRSAIDFPLVGIGVMVRLEGKGGACTGARIVLGALDSGPVVAKDASEYLHGERLSEEVIKTASELAMKAARPVNNIVGSSAAYRRKMVAEFTRRALTKALKRIN